MNITLSDSDAAALGITKASEFGAVLTAKLGEIDTLKASFDALTTSLNSQIKPLSDSVGALTTSLSTVSGKVDAIKVPTTEQIKDAASLAAATALGSAGFQPVAPSGQSDVSTAAEKKDFAAIVSDYQAAGKTKAEAVRLAVRNHPAEFAAAKAAGIATL